MGFIMDLNDLSIYLSNHLRAILIEIEINDTHRGKTCAFLNSVQKFIEMQG